MNTRVFNHIEEVMQIKGSPGQEAFCHAGLNSIINQFANLAKIESLAF